MPFRALRPQSAAEIQPYLTKYTGEDAAYRSRLVNGAITFVEIGRTMVGEHAKIRRGTRVHYAAGKLAFGKCWGSITFLDETGATGVPLRFERDSSSKGPAVAAEGLAHYLGGPDVAVSEEIGDQIANETRADRWQLTSDIYNAPLPPYAE